MEVEAAVLVPWWPADPVLLLRAGPFLISLLQGKGAAWECWRAVYFKPFFSHSGNSLE